MGRTYAQPQVRLSFLRSNFVKLLWATEQGELKENEESTEHVEFD